jgi:uncharacterized integral membrane protein
MGVVIIILLIVLIVAAFSVQNAAPVAIAFLFWKFQASLAIVVFLSAIAGLAIGVIATMFMGAKRRGKTKQASATGQ